MDYAPSHPARTALIALAAAVFTFPVALQTGRPAGSEEVVSAKAAIVDASQSAIPGHEAREFPRAPDGLFYVTAAINGQPVRFLVDTGASVIVLSARDAARTGLAGQAKYDAHMETANGKAPMAWTRIDRVEIGGRQVAGLRAALVQQGLSVSLLGQNALAKLGPVTMEGDRLRLG